MSDWIETTVKDLAKPGPMSFIDGDWIESPYITSEGVRLIQTGNLGIGNFVNGNKKYISERTLVQLRCNEVFPGDLLICRLADPIGRACIVPSLIGRFITSVDVCILRVDEFRHDKHFVLQRINDRQFLNRCAEVSGGTTRQRISRSQLGNLTLSMPPLIQQQKIARILTTVDNLIEKTESLIAKYQAIKQGMMHDLFTRGVDAHGHLRPPQTEAPDLYKQSELGWIPKDWDVVSLNRINNRIKRGPSLSTNLQGKGIRYLTSDNIIADGRLDWTVRKHLDVAPSSLSSILEVGDVLINCVNSEEQIGKTGYVDALPENTTIGFNSFAISFQQNLIVPRFGYYQISDSRFQLMLRKMVKPAINQASFSSTDIVDMPFAKPSLHEQAQILSRLDAITSLIVAEQSPLQNLRQLKNGLMQDLLTGKVQVKVDEPEGGGARV